MIGMKSNYTARVSAVLPEYLHAELIAYSREKLLSPSAVTRLAIAEYLDRRTVRGTPNDTDTDK